MAKLPADVRTAMEQQKEFPIATASTTGVPNLIYMTYVKVVDDETILLADNYWHKTRQNLQSNPQAAVAVRDEKGSFQIKGRTEWLTSGPLFDEMQSWVPDTHPRTAVGVLHVEEVYRGSTRLV